MPTVWYPVSGLIEHDHANRCRDATQRRFRIGRIFPSA